MLGHEFQAETNKQQLFRSRLFDRISVVSRPLNKFPKTRDKKVVARSSGTPTSFRRKQASSRVFFPKRAWSKWLFSPETCAVPRFTAE